MKTYQGIYKVKNKEKYKGDPDKVVYRSGWEKYCMLYFDKSPEVVSWSSEEIVIPYLYDADHRHHRYFPDFVVTWNTGKTSLVEVKPNKETKPPTGTRKTKKLITEALTYVKNMNKWEAATEYCKDKGWRFEIWTEIELRLMGILPKQPKPMKKLKPMAPYKKRKAKKSL